MSQGVLLGSAHPTEMIAISLSSVLLLLSSVESFSVAHCTERVYCLPDVDWIDLTAKVLFIYVVHHSIARGNQAF